MSIGMRKRQARAKIAQTKKERSMRHPRPALCALALPDDVAGNRARVILLGNDHALVENHVGVAAIGRECIRLTTREGILSFYGTNLKLMDVREGALSVFGQIERLELPHAMREEAVHRD